MKTLFLVILPLVFTAQFNNSLFNVTTGAVVAPISATILNKVTNKKGWSLLCGVVCSFGTGILLTNTIPKLLAHEPIDGGRILEFTHGGLMGTMCLGVTWNFKNSDKRKKR